MQVTVITAHRSNYPDPIEFHQGDSLKTGIRDTEYEGWVRVTTAGGKEGWAPEQYVEQVSATDAVALCSYTARELDTEAGESLRIHTELNEWLWVENERGESGWVPRKTVV